MSINNNNHSFGQKYLAAQMNMILNKNQETKNETQELKTTSTNNQQEVTSNYEPVTAGALDALATYNMAFVKQSIDGKQLKTAANNATSNSQIDNIKQDIKEITDTQKDIEDQYKDDDNNRSQLKSKNRGPWNKYNTYRDAAIKAYDKVKESLNQEISFLQNIDELQGENEGLNKRINEITAQITELTQQKTDIINNKDNITDVQIKISEVKGEIARLQSKIDTLKTSNNQIQTSINNLKNDLSNLETQKAQNEHQLELWQQDYNPSGSAAPTGSSGTYDDKATEMIKIFTDAIASLNKQIEEKNGTIKYLEDEYNTNNHTILNANAKLAGYNEELKELNKILSDLNNVNLEDIENRINDLTKEKTKVESTITANNAKIAEYQENLANQQEQTQAAREDASNKKTAFDQQRNYLLDYGYIKRPGGGGGLPQDPWGGDPLGGGGGELPQRFGPGEDINGHRVPDGGWGQRNSDGSFELFWEHGTNNNNNSSHHESFDPSGNLVSRETTVTNPDGSTVTTRENFDPNSNNDKPRTSVTESFDSHGNLTGRNSTVNNPDGSTTETEETFDPKNPNKPQHRRRSVINKQNVRVIDIGFVEYGNSSLKLANNATVELSTIFGELIIENNEDGSGIVIKSADENNSNLNIVFDQDGNPISGYPQDVFNSIQAAIAPTTPQEDENPPSNIITWSNGKTMDISKDYPGYSLVSSGDTVRLQNENGSIIEFNAAGVKVYEKSVRTSDKADSYIREFYFDDNGKMLYKTDHYVGYKDSKGQVFDRYVYYDSSNNPVYTAREYDNGQASIYQYGGNKLLKLSDYKDYNVTLNADGSITLKKGDEVITIDKEGNRL